MLDRFRAWLDRWGAILPLLVAEFIVWLGFGGLLPAWRAARMPVTTALRAA